MQSDGDRWFVWLTSSLGNQLLVLMGLIGLMIFIPPLVRMSYRTGRRARRKYRRRSSRRKI
jgi:hypothetical protein